MNCWEQVGCLEHTCQTKADCSSGCFGIIEILKLERIVLDRLCLPLQITSILPPLVLCPRSLTCGEFISGSLALWLPVSQVQSMKGTSTGWQAGAGAESLRGNPEVFPSSNVVFIPCPITTCLGSGNGFLALTRPQTLHLFLTLPTPV